MGRAPRRAVAALVCAAAALTACTVGPSQRPPVAVRGDMPPAPTTSPAPLPGGELLPAPDSGLATIAFDDCTADVLLGSPPAPPDRALRVDCGEITVPADPQQPTLGRIALGVHRVRLADAPDDLPPLLAVGDTGSDPSAFVARTVSSRSSPTKFPFTPASSPSMSNTSSPVSPRDCGFSPGLN